MPTPDLYTAEDHSPPGAGRMAEEGGTNRGGDYGVTPGTAEGPDLGESESN